MGKDLLAFKHKHIIQLRVQYQFHFPTVNCNFFFGWSTSSILEILEHDDFSTEAENIFCIRKIPPCWWEFPLLSQLQGVWLLTGCKPQQKASLQSCLPSTAAVYAGDVILQQN